MPDPRVNVILGAKDEASKVVGGLRGQLEQFKKDAIKGFGLGAGFSAFKTLKGVVTDVAGAMLDAARSAAEEEAEVAQLTTALRENAEGWDGNVDAIEAVLTARQKLAFSDSEQRTSLAKLVAITGDHTEALALSRQAMDLARLRNIDLGTASELLGKVYAGNVSILRRYGIVVRQGATSTEALAAIQKQSMGQAQAYAETSLGKWRALELKIEDVKEAIGVQLLPGLDALATGAEAAFDPIGTANLLLGVLQANLEGNTVAFKATFEAMKDMAPQLGITTEQLRAMIQRADDSNQSFELFARNVNSRLIVFREARAEMEAQGFVFDELTATWKQAAVAVDGLGGSFASLASIVAASRKKALHETMKLAPSMADTIKANKGQVREAMMDLRFALEHPFMGDRYVRFLEKKQQQANRLLNRAIRDGNTDATAEARALVFSVTQELVKLKGADFVIRVDTRVTSYLPRPERRAHGGPTTATRAYLVGEGGPELWAERTSGHMFTAPQTQRMLAAAGPGRMSSSGGPIPLHVHLDGREIASSVDHRLGDRWSLTRAGDSYRSA